MSHLEEGKEEILMHIGKCLFSEMTFKSRLVFTYFQWHGQNTGFLSACAERKDGSAGQKESNKF